MNCCIAKKKAREENAHRSLSTEIDDVEETGNIRNTFNCIFVWKRSMEKLENSSLRFPQNPRKRNSSNARVKSRRARRFRQRGCNWRRSTCCGTSLREDWLNIHHSGWLILASDNRKLAEIRVKFIEWNSVSWFAKLKYFNLINWERKKIKLVSWNIWFFY